jgi:hypothetical protein
MFRNTGPPSSISIRDRISIEKSLIFAVFLAIREILQQNIGNEITHMCGANIHHIIVEILKKLTNDVEKNKISQKSVEVLTQLFKNGETIAVRCFLDSWISYDGFELLYSYLKKHCTFKPLISMIDEVHCTCRNTTLQSDPRNSLSENELFESYLESTLAEIIKIQSTDAEQLEKWKEEDRERANNIWESKARMISEEEKFEKRQKYLFKIIEGSERLTAKYDLILDHINVEQSREMIQQFHDLTRQWNDRKQQIDAEFERQKQEWEQEWEKRKPQMFAEWEQEWEREWEQTHQWAKNRQQCYTRMKQYVEHAMQCYVQWKKAENYIFI